MQQNDNVELPTRDTASSSPNEPTSSTLEFSDNPKQDTAISNRVKDPNEWVTGDETMTGAQASYLKTLSEEAHEDFDPSLTKAEASKRIEELQGITGRGATTEEV